MSPLCFCLLQHQSLSIWKHKAVHLQARLESRIPMKGSAEATTRVVTSGDVSVAVIFIFIYFLHSRDASLVHYYCIRN